jgi:uncharacterized membrane protein
MSDPEEIDEQKENTQMNWFVAIVLAVGSPLLVLAYLDHYWAEIAFKVYLCTAAVFGSLLIFLERKFLRNRWLWIAMVPLLVLHSAVMCGLILFNESFPVIDRFPVATYGALIPLMALEEGIFYVLLERFRPKKDKQE